MTATATLTAWELDDLEEDRNRLSMRLNKVINAFAGRDDLLLECIWSRESGQPDAPAWFVPATGWVTIDATFALQGAHPAKVNPLTPQGRREHPVIVGLCCHEASHAHSTHWPEDMSKRGVPSGVLRTAVLLEEPRIEARQIERRPQDRPYLRAQSVLIDLSKFNDSEVPELDRWRAATSALMVLARVDAGVLEESDAEIVEPILRDRLGDDLDALREVWNKAIDLDDGDFDGLVAAAQEWVDILGEPPAEGLSMPGCGAGATGEDVPSDDEWDEDSEGSGGDSSEQDEMDGALAEAMAQMIENALTEAVEELAADEALSHDSTGKERVEQVEQEAADRKKQKQHAKRAESVFGKIGSIRSLSYREPTPQEQVLSREIGTILRHARFRERTATKIRSEVPPGRLDGREAMQGGAQRAMRMPVTAKPFRSTRHRHSPEPPITLGIMADKSGSMGWATSLMSTLTWSFAHAMTYVQGRAASVIYGRDVIALTQPGFPPPQVAQFTASDGTEDFKGAFGVLDAALNLTMGRGVRLLVVISDGMYVDSQAKAARDAVARMNRNGGIVLWVTEDGYSNIPEGAIPVIVDTSEPSKSGLPKGASTVPAAMVTALAIALNS